MTAVTSECGLAPREENSRHAEGGGGSRPSTRPTGASLPTSRCARLPSKIWPIRFPRSCSRWRRATQRPSSASARSSWCPRARLCVKPPMRWALRGGCASCRRKRSSRPLPALPDRSRVRLSHRRAHPARSPARCRSGWRAWPTRTRLADRTTPCGLARQDDLIASAEEFLHVHGCLGVVQRASGAPWEIACCASPGTRNELQAGREKIECLASARCGSSSAWAPASRRPGSATVRQLGFTFVALRTVDDFVAESEALDNCLDQYADHLRTGATAVFSIRKNAT